MGCWLSIALTRQAELAIVTRSYIIAESLVLEKARDTLELDPEGDEERIKEIKNVMIPTDVEMRPTTGRRASV